MMLPHATTMFILIGMAKALARLGIENGVRVNAITPGTVCTPFIARTLHKENVEKLTADTLFERAAQSAELAPDLCMAC